jgi:hypothetical protein
MSKKKWRKITPEVKLLIWANWDYLHKEDLRSFIGCSWNKIYEVVKEKKKVKKQPHTCYFFWKPYLDRILINNKPFVLQEVCKNHKLDDVYLNLGGSFFKRYKRTHPGKILINSFGHTPKGLTIVYTEESRVEAWEKLLEIGAIKKDNFYLSRYGKAILGKHLAHHKGESGRKTIW